METGQSMMSKEKAQEYQAMLERVRLDCLNDRELRAEITGAIKAVSHILNPKGEWVQNELEEWIRL